MVFCFFGIFQKLLFSDNLLFFKILLFSDMLSHHMPCGPGGLQIEAACDGIDVEHFAGKEEVRAHLALQGMQVDVAEADAAAGRFSTGYVESAIPPESYLPVLHPHGSGP